MKVYVLGDSISVHYGPFLQRELQGFADYARKGGADASGRDWENPTDANGGDSRLVLKFLEANLPSIEADVLLLNCGLHDLRVDRKTGEYQVPLPEYRENVASAVRLIRSHGVEPIWLTTSPVIDEVHNRHSLAYHRFSRDVVAYNETAVQVMNESEVSIIDLCAFTQNLGPEIFIDHVHLTGDARREQARFIAEQLRQRYPR